LAGSKFLASTERLRNGTSQLDHAKLVELTAAVQVEQPIDFSMLDAEERQQLRAMLERRRGPVPVGDDAGVRALPVSDEDLEDAA
jgi:hypothetical protein